MLKFSELRQATKIILESLKRQNQNLSNFDGTSWNPIRKGLNQFNRLSRINSPKKEQKDCSIYEDNL